MMRRTTLTATLAGLTAAALGLAGCGGSGDHTTGKAAGNQTPVNGSHQVTDYDPQPYDNLKQGGTYTTSSSFSGDDSQGLVWNVNVSLTGQRIWNWYNPLAVTFSPTGAVQINKDYYTSATEKSVGGKQVVTLTINPKAVYNDGTPIDWHSIEATWKVASGRTKAYQVGSTTGFDQIESVKQGVDSRQAVVTFAHPYTAWPSLFSSFINPKAATVANFNNAYSNKVEPQWGAGPYTVKSYDPNSKKLIFTRNPRWWGRPGRLDSRIYLDLGDHAAAINAFKNKQIDYSGVETADERKQVAAVSGSTVRQGASPFEYFLFLNGRSPLLKDPQVRHAVLASVNRPQIAQIEFQGLNYSEPLPGSALYYSFQKGYQDNVSKVISFNTGDAGKILDADGWKPGPDGIRVKNGQKLSLTYILYSTEALDKATAQSLVASLKQAGIDLQIKTINDAQWATTINGGKFDLIVSGDRSVDPYGANLLSSFYGSKNSNNITRVGTPALDQQIAAVNQIADPQQQIQAANALEVKALGLYSQLPLYSGPSTYGVKDGLANVGATIYFNPLPETIGWQK